MLNIETFSLGSMKNNCYLVYDENKNGVIIDIPEGIEKVLDFVSENEINIKYVLLTHGHYDHILGLDILKERLTAPVVIAKDGAFMLEGSNSFPGKSLATGFLPKTKKADMLINDGDILKFGDTEIEVILTPGHTPADTIYKIEDNLFTGDTLFKGTIGRCDLEGGNYDLLVKGVNDLLKYPLETKVFPGHDSATTLGYEKETNPYLNGKGE